MSVVNKMLQDLETRKKASNFDADYVPVQTTSFMQSGSSKVVLISLAALLACIAIMLIKWNGEKSEQTNIYAQQLPVGDSDIGKLESIPVSPDVALTKTLPTSKNAYIDEAASIINDTSESLKNPASAAQSTQVLAANGAADYVHDDYVENDYVKNTASSATKSAEDQKPIVTAAIDAQTNAPQSEPSSEFTVSPSGGTSADVSALREQARIALEKNNISDAINTLEQLISAYPEDVRARKQLASLLFSHHGIERAYNVLKEGLAMTPADNPMRIMLARVAFKTGDFKDAHTVLSEHPYPNLANIELLSFRAALAERLSQYQTAYQDYQMLVSREPQNAKWWLGLGVSQDKLELQEQALDSYQQARSLNQLPEQVNLFVEQRISALAERS